MICLTCDELTKHKTQTIQKRVKQTVLDKIAPKDPTAKRPGFYVLLDKPVGGLPSNDGVGHHPVYINGDRLVTFAKMVGGIADENILEMLRTAKGFRKLVHSVGVSIVGDLPDKVVTFTLGFSGELGSGGSRNSMKITTDGTEHIMVMDEQQWSDSDETPQEFLFELVKPKDIATATVKLYLNDGYTVPEVDPDPPVAFDTPAYGEMIARSCLSTGNNIRIKRVLQQLRDGKPTTSAFLGGSITQGAGAVPSQEMCYARKTYEAICERYTPDHGAHVRYIKAGVGGTPCQLGIIRYDRDITRDGAVQPDLIIVEFAVNDEADETKGLMHESLIQKIWSAPNEPAVVMLFSVFANDWNLKKQNREQFDYYRNLIAMRKAHPAFRMTSAADIARNIVFDKVKEDCVVSYSIKNHANGDEWQEVKVVFNGNDRDVTVNVAKGNWTVVAADGKIDKDGLGKSKGGKTVVASRSALILAR